MARKTSNTPGAAEKPAKPKTAKARAKKPAAKRGASKPRGARAAAAAKVAVALDKTHAQQSFVRIMFRKGATIDEVAGYLDVDPAALESVIAAEPDLRPEPDDEPNKGGRPTLYDEKFVKQAVQLAKLGATDLEISQFFEISIRTLYRWKLEHEDFAEALQIGKDQADDRVEQSLYQRATGYSFDSEKIVTVEGQVHRIPTIEHVPPDTKAALAWLFNRRSDKWRTTNHIKHDVPAESPLGKFLDKITGTAMQPVDDSVGLDPKPAFPIADDDEG